MKTQAIEFINELITDNTTKKELELLDFIKKCIREYRVECKKTFEPYINELYQKFYAIYVKKGSKEQGRKTFLKKLIKLKTEEQILDKARLIVKIYHRQLQIWENEEREKKYIPFISSWLNANVSE